MRLVGTIFSFIFAVVAVPLFALAACNVAVKASVINRSTYDGILENDAIFEDLLTVSLPAVFGIDGGDNVDFQQTGDSPIDLREMVTVLQGKPEVFEEFAALLMPPDWLQTTTTQFVDVAFGVIDGNLDSIDSEVNFGEIRARFAGDEAVQAAALLIDEAPTCTQTQTDQLSRYLASNEGQIPICKPEDEASRNQLMSLVTAWFGSFAEQLNSDTITMSELFGINRDDAQSLHLFADLNTQSMLLVYLCPSAFLALIVIFAVRSRRGFGLWLGSISVVTGVVILIMIFVLQVAAFNIVSEALSADDEAGQFLGRLASELIRSAFGESSSSLFVQAALFMAVGFILFVVAFIAGRGGQETGETVLITDDGQIISTASQRRIGSLNEPIDKA